MWHRIKQLFSKPKQEEHVLQAKEDELAQKLPAYVEQRATSFFEQHQELLDKFKTATATIQQQLDGFKTATLRNPNIPERAKHYMEGNRESFIIRTQQCATALAQPSSYTDLPQWFMTTQETLKTYAESTERSRKILNEFFSDEIRQILQSVQEFENIYTTIKQQYEEEKIAELLSLPAYVNAIATAKHKVKQQQLEKEQHEKQLQQARQAHEEISSRQQELQQSPAYQEFEQQKEELKNLLNTTREQKRSLEEMFQPVSAALKKYSHMQVRHTDLIQSYLDHPVETLARDTRMTIIIILAEVQQAINENKLDLTDKRRSQALAAITDLSQHKLQEFLKEYGGLRKKEAQLLGEINANPARQKVKELSKDMERKQQEIDQLEGKDISIDHEKVVEAKQALIDAANGAHLKLVID